MHLDRTGFLQSEAYPVAMHAGRHFVGDRKGRSCETALLDGGRDHIHRYGHAGEARIPLLHHALAEAIDEPSGGPVHLTRGTLQ